MAASLSTGRSFALGPRMSLASFAVALLMLAAWPSNVTAASLEDIKKRGYMIVATEDDYPPFEFVVDGKPMGYDHELLSILRKSAGDWQVFRLETGGPVIGLFRQGYAQECFVLEPGDSVVLFTDGVSESMNDRDEDWGEDRLIELAKTCARLPALETMSRIFAAAEAFAAGAPQHDDMTLVVLRILAD